MKKNTKLQKALWRFVVAQAGVAAVEFSLTAPILLLALGLVTFAGQGFELQRRVELTTATVANLVASAPLAKNGNSVNTSPGATYINQSDLDTDLALAAEVMFPYDVTNLKITASQLAVDAQSNTGQVGWSEPYYGATALPFLSTINLDPTLAKAGMAYLIYVQITYTYQPLGVFAAIGPITFNDTQILAPRNANHIEVNWGM